MVNQKIRSRKYNKLSGKQILLNKFVVPHGKLKSIITIYDIYDFLNRYGTHYTSADCEQVVCFIRKARYNGKYVTLYINEDDTVSIPDFIIDRMYDNIGTIPNGFSKNLNSKLVEPDIKTKGTLNVTIYEKPNGRKVPTDITNVYKDDADYINNTGIKVSMEETGGTFAVYFDYGEVDDGEPVEHIEFALGKSCEDTIKSGVESIKIIRKLEKYNVT